MTRRHTLAAAVVGLLALPSGARAADQYIGTFEPGTPALSLVSGVAASGSSVFVSDLASGIYRYDYTGHFIGTFAKAGTAGVVGIAAGTDGDVYAVAHGDVERFRDNGTFIGKVGTSGPLSERVADAAGPIAVDDKGNLFVYDITQHDIVSFDDAGAFRFRFGDSAGLPSVNAIAVNPFTSSRIYVATSDPAKPVQAFDAAGKPVADMDRLGATGNISEAAGISVTPGNLIVIANKRGELVEVTADGAVAARIPTGLGGGAFSAQPGKLATNCRGDIYVRFVPAEFSQADSVARYGDLTRPAPPCAARRAHGPFGGDTGTAAGPDVRLTYMEVTQGVQPLGCPGCVAGRDLDYATDMGGVKLVNNHKTIVRAYADVSGGGSGGIGDVPMTMTVTVAGVDFGPYSPIHQPAAVVVGPGTASDAVRLDQTQAYTFEVPSIAVDRATARGPMTLRAQIAPGGVPGSPPQCVTCEENDRFTIRSVRFQQAPRLTIFTVALMANGKFPVFPSGSPASNPEIDLSALFNPNGTFASNGSYKSHAGFAVSRQTIPAALDIQGWNGVIDVDDELRNPNLDSTERMKIVAARLADWQDDHGYDNALVVGVTSTDAIRGVFSDKKRAIVSLDRPLTSIGHELTHAMGVPHASACNTSAADGDSEAWPPDEQGLLQGIAIDTLEGSGGGHGPFRIFGSTASATCQPADKPGENTKCGKDKDDAMLFHDLMSYCAAEIQTWVSPRNWNAIVDSKPGFNYSGSGKTYYASAAEPTSIRVRATAPVVPGGAPPAIQDTTPTNRPVPDEPTTSGYRFQLRDAAGAVVAEAPALTGVSHSDGVALELALTGTLPAKGNATQVVMVGPGGAPVAVVTRSAHTPTATFSGIRRGQRIGGKGNVTVRWKAADADGPALSIKLEYSIDGGKRWFLLAEGPNRNKIQLPARAFPASRRARLRLRADDGFTSAVATSPVFVSLGGPPSVTIFGPTAAARVRQDGAISLSGQAVDDADHRIRGHQLRWLIGRRVIGTGEEVTANGLPAGRPRIRLEATDSHGRKASLTTRPTVTAVRPVMIALSAPKTFARRARSVKVRVATNVTTRLTVGSRRYSVGRHTKTIAAALPKTGTTVTLTLRIGRGRLSSTSLVVLRRR